MDTPNGKITLALVKQSIDTLIKVENDHYHDLRTMIEGQDGCIRSLDIDVAKNKTRIDNVEGDIKTLEEKSDRWSVINTIGMIVAGILGAFGIQK